MWFLPHHSQVLIPTLGHLSLHMGAASLCSIAASSELLHLLLVSKHSLGILGGFDRIIQQRSVREEERVTDIRNVYRKMDIIKRAKTWIGNSTCEGSGSDPDFSGA